VTLEFTIMLRCPNKRCGGRFLLEADGLIARVVCPSCGGELIFRCREARGEALTIPAAASRLVPKAT